MCCNQNFMLLSMKNKLDLLSIKKVVQVGLFLPIPKGFHLLECSCLPQFLLSPQCDWLLTSKYLY